MSDDSRLAASVDDPRFTAGLDVLGRTGAISIQIRWMDDAPPVVFCVVVEHELDGARHFDAAAGMTPLAAVLRACELLVDGGVCLHCGRPAGFDPDPASWSAAISDGVRTVEICFYRWDPELATFRRGCEGQ